MTIEQEIHSILIGKRLTLAFAESCTGGTLASRLTALPGASNYFLGSIVAYSNKLKTTLLGVPPEFIDREGAVSEAVAQAMVEGLLIATEADFGIAVTGIAGPTGGSSEKPVGTVCAAIAKRGMPPVVWTFTAGKERQEIISSTCTLIFKELKRLI